ncbi:ubiquinone biosynthesis protein COQ7-domain-containing protein [Boletus coccyginus]|nr:ubiquinone biosynthesis protein COQ7-domain-containing protein [Boletus coccyginus]
MTVLGRDPTVGPLIQEMWNQEKRHLLVMDKLQVQHQVRPTMLFDVAKAAGYGLGVVTALLGKEAAMACTEAVETAIGEHYDDTTARVRIVAVITPQRAAATKQSLKSYETMNSSTSTLQSSIIRNAPQLMHS